MSMQPAPEVPVKPSPEVIRRLLGRLESTIADFQQRFGNECVLTLNADDARGRFAEARYFMYPFQTGMVYCRLPGLTIGVGATDTEFEILQQSSPSSISSESSSNG